MPEETKGENGAKMERPRIVPMFTKADARALPKPGAPARRRVRDPDVLDQFDMAHDTGPWMVAVWRVQLGHTIHGWYKNSDGFPLGDFRKAVEQLAEMLEPKIRQADVEARQRDEAFRAE